MSRRICQTLLAIGLCYLAGLGLFALLAYRGPRPDVLTMARDLNRFVVGRGAPALPPPEDGEVPPEVVPAPSTPSPAPVPAPVLPDLPAPSADPRKQTLAKVSDELLPEAERLMAAIKTESPTLQDDKARARVVLVQARDLLGALLDRDRKDADAHALYKRVMEHLIAVDKR
jgi:hypothetical protein